MREAATVEKWIQETMTGAGMEATDLAAAMNRADGTLNVTARRLTAAFRGDTELSAQEANAAYTAFGVSADDVYYSLIREHKEA